MKRDQQDEKARHERPFLTYFKMEICLMRTLFSAAVLAGSLAMLCTVPAHAKSPGKTATTTGLEVIHTLKREGNRLCMVGHYHYGVEDSQKNKADALKKAKAKWSYFVTLEYGTAWGNFNLAANKGAKCSGKKDNYRCSVEARPCRYFYKR
jgi:hypothetical protein